MISVLILTRDEAATLGACLESIAWCDDVHVLDSHSTDGTQQLASAAGAHVVERTFDDYATQRNYGLTALPFRHPWVLILDADERPSPELSAEMLQAVQQAADAVAAFRLTRRDYLWGTWLRHAQLTPTYIRLVRRGRAGYTRAVNEVLAVDGNIGDLQGPLLHYPFAKGISWWVERHNRYSSMEAALFATGDATADGSLRSALFAKSPQVRRAAQKALFYRMPGRPMIKWCYMMLVRGAVLDGPAGWMYATLQAFYEYLIEVKQRERERTDRGLPL